MRAGFEKQIVKLRVELERGKEQFSREKKLLLLRIEELEEQQQMKENQTPTNNKTGNHLNTTPTLNVTTPPCQQSTPAPAPTKVKTPKQQFKYKSFLSPTAAEFKEEKEVEEKKPIKVASSSSKTKEPAPECSQQ